MEYVVRQLSTDILQVDQRYQRPVNTELVAKIASHYSAPLFSPLLVAKRQDSRGEFFYVVDGQHRLEAARLLSLPTVPCFVYENMSPAQEAELFVNQQVASARLTPRDTYKANVFIGNPENIDVIIEKVLHKYGHRIGIHEHDTNGWYAIVSLRDTVKRIGADGLGKILVILNQLKWTQGRAAKSRLMLVGLAHAIKKGIGMTTVVEVFSERFQNPEDFIALVVARSKGRKQTVEVIDVIDEIFKEYLQ